MPDHLKILTLGGVRILLNNTPVTSLITRKVEALLIYLACNPGEHQREVLAEMFWDDLPAERAAGNFRNILSNLRQNLDPFLLVTRQTVAINPDSDVSLDLRELDEALRLCEKHWKDYGTFSRPVMSQLDEAIGLYRGVFLEGFYLRDSRGFEGWSMLESERVRTQLIDALIRLAAAATKRGDFSDSARYANRLLQLDTLNEEAHRLLMSSLTLAGQRPAALAQYELCRKLLDEELGVEPEDETLALYEEIREGSYTAPVPVTQAVSHLPHDTTAFVPRPDLQAEIARMIDQPDCRLLTLVGVGGTGKTRLAVEAARQRQDAYTDGVHFVDLAGVDLPELVPQAVAVALEFSPTGSQTLERALLTYLKGRELLLVLDNFEHVMAAADFVAEMLRQSVNVKIIATTRERLNLQHEWALAVGGMALSDDGETQGGAAFQLFVQQARRVRPDFKAEAHREAITQLCGLLGGLPLAIELAAAWLRTMTPDHILKAVQQNLDILTTHLRDVPERHRSVRAVFESTWAMLSGEEQRVLRGLSVFHGDFGMDAGGALLNTTPFTLAALYDRALVTIVDGRCKLHELLRQFAAEKLSAFPEERGALLLLHRDYYADFLVEREAQINYTLRDSLYPEMVLEIDNILQAWHTALADGDENRINGFLRSLYHFYHARDLKAGEATMRTVVERFDAVGEMPLRPVQSRALLFYSMFMQHQNHYDDAAALMARVKPVFLAEGMAWEYQRVLLFEAVQHFIHSAFADAIETYERLLGQELEPVDSVYVLMRIAEAYQALGEYERALGYLNESETLVMQHMGEKMLGAYLIVRGGLELEMGYYEESESHFHEALALAVKHDLAIRQCSALINLGSIALEQHNPGTALGYLRRCLSLATSLGSRFTIASTHIQIGRSHVAAGDLVQAQLHFQHALRVSREIGTEWLEAHALRYVSRVHLALGQPAEAFQVLEDALMLLLQTRPKPLMLEIFAGFAEVMAYDRQYEEAARLAMLVIHSRERTYDTLTKAEHVLGQVRAHVAESTLDALAAQVTEAAHNLDDTINTLLARREEQRREGQHHHKTA